MPSWEIGKTNCGVNWYANMRSCLFMMRKRVVGSCSGSANKGAWAASQSQKPPYTPCSYNGQGARKGFQIEQHDHCETAQVFAQVCRMDYRCWPNRGACGQRSYDRRRRDHLCYEDIA